MDTTLIKLWGQDVFKYWNKIPLDCVVLALR